MSAPRLQLPAILLPDAVKTSRGLRVKGQYYRAVASGYRLDLTLPQRAYAGHDSRASVPGIVHGLYLASDAKTTMCEVWSPVKDRWQKKDLHRVSVDVSNIFDLRDMTSTPWIADDCFRLGHPPSRTHRNYAPWHYLTYAIWSAGFAGVIWKSERYAGDALSIYALEGRSFVKKDRLLERAIRPDEWLKRNP